MQQNKVEIMALKLFTTSRIDLVASNLPFVFGTAPSSKGERNAKKKSPYNLRLCLQNKQLPEDAYTL